MSQFAAPASPASGIQWADFQGALLILSVQSIESSISTSFGEVENVPRVNLAVLDGDKAGEEHTEVLVFPKVLSSQVRSQVGQKVLGRLGQGNAKPGQSAPWMLTAATAEDQQVASDWLAKRNAPVAPAAPPAAPAQQTPAPSGVPF